MGQIWVKDWTCAKNMMRSYAESHISRRMSLTGGNYNS